MADYLSELKLLQRDTKTVDTALSAFEENMFGVGHHPKGQEQAANDVAPDSLRYLFGIFN